MTTASENEEQTPTLEEQLLTLLPKMLAHAYTLTRSKQSAEDLVQDTLVRALDRKEQRDNTARLDGWVARIMDSIWFNKLRKKYQRQEQELPEPDQVPEQGFERAAQARLMLDMMPASGAATEEDFLLLEQYHVYGYTLQELADEYRVPLGTMFSRISRIKAALMKAAHERDRKGKMS